MSKSRKIVHSTLLAALLSLPFSTTTYASDPSVILVHGAFSDGSAWSKVIPLLQEAGITVSAAQLPLSTLSGDAEVVSRLIELQDGPVILVGHSYGGNVITEAGAHESVQSLVYVAGFALDKGQALTDLLEGQPAAPWQAEAIADGAGYVRLSEEGIAKYFANDLPKSEAAIIAATQGPIKYKINYEAPTIAAWSMKPTRYVMTENDQIIPPKLQAYFAKRMDAVVTPIASSHVAMLAQPSAVANVIIEAVTAASTK